MTAAAALRWPRLNCVLITVAAYDPSPWMLFTASPMNAPSFPPKSSDGSAKAWPLPADAFGWFWPPIPLVSGGFWSCAAEAAAIRSVAAMARNRM